MQLERQSCPVAQNPGLRKHMLKDMRVANFDTRPSFSKPPEPGWPSRRDEIT
jgi:hypothetical protein